jgi:Domain of unknown function, B. Theta Gene description (DUF3871)
MELIQMPQEGSRHPHALSVAVNNDPTPSKPFIEANTIEGSLRDIKQNHIIPVFHRDNEPAISQVDFMELTQDVLSYQFSSERISEPQIRLSHPIKGRVPEARNKPASELLEWEKTLYYERMAFIIEIPSISETISGEKLSLTVGGIKAYNLDNLSGKSGSDQHFKLFIGWKVKVCTNLCVWTDGFTSDVRIKNLDQLKAAIFQLVGSFDAISQLRHMESLSNYFLTESQFAQLIGRCRMYQHLPAHLKQQISELQFGDSQINSVCKDYYRDNSFCRAEGGTINLWRLHNLFTSANKQSYIDTFLDRAVNATSFVGELAYALEHRQSSWFLM